MPGDDWQKFANLRLLYSYMYTHPGNKLLFMGAEFGQPTEWNFNEQLEWPLLKNLSHKGVQTLVKDLNKLFKKEASLASNNFNQEGFEWVSHDETNCILVYIRKTEEEKLLVVCNFTPQVIYDYKIGVAEEGKYKVILNSDDIKYSGSGVTKTKTYHSKKIESHGKEHSLELALVPLGTLILKLA